MWPPAPSINLLAWRRRGFGIAETLIASFILASMVLAFFGLTAALGRNIKSAYYRSVAANLAQSQLERLRWQVESNWQSSRRPDSPPSSWDANLNLSSLIPPIPVEGVLFTVAVTPIQVNPQLRLSQATATGSEPLPNPLPSDAQTQIKGVQVDVSWNEGGQARNYTVKSFITNWREGLM